MAENTYIFLEKIGDAHENTHTKTRAQIVRVPQDDSKFSKPDVSAIAWEDTCQEMNTSDTEEESKSRRTVIAKGVDGRARGA